jgi:hypothetical protein
MSIEEALLNLFSSRWLRPPSDDADDGISTEANTSKCYTSLAEEVTKHGFEIDDTFEILGQFHPCDYVRRRVAIKWGHKGSGGWHVAVIHLADPPTDECNCWLNHIYSDKHFGPAMLNADMMVADLISHDQNHAKFSWLMLQELTDASVSPEMLKNPTGSKHGKGRPRLNRLRPSFGPTS